MPPPSRITYVLRTFPELTETFVFREIRALLGRGVPVTVLAAGRGSGEALPGLDVRYLPPAADLRTWGVRRLSAGSAIAAAALGITRDLTSQFLEHGRSDALFNDPIEYGRMNALLSARAAVP